MEVQSCTSTHKISSWLQFCSTSHSFRLKANLPPRLNLDPASVQSCQWLAQLFLAGVSTMSHAKHFDVQNCTGTFVPNISRWRLKTFQAIS
jgi:hypothetical protein